MFGFKAFSEAPISAEVEAQTTVVIENVGAIGASAIGVHAIGRATTQTVVGGTSATASASIPAITVSSPAPTATVIVTGSASVPAITLTSPAPTVTVSSTASATAATITVTSPAPTATATTSVTASATAATISVGSPVGSVSGSGNVTVADLSSSAVSITPVDADGALSSTSTNSTREVTSVYRRTNFSTVNLTFPTTFTVSSSISSTYAGSWTVQSYTSVNTRLVRWIDLGTSGSTYKRIARVWFIGKRSTDSSNDTYSATWEFDTSGNLTLTDFDAFMHWASNPTDGESQLSSSGWLDGNLETHSNASGDFQLITPALAVYPSSSSLYGTWGYVNVKQLSDGTNKWSESNANSINYTPWALGQLTTNSDTVTLVKPGTSNDWPANAYALPWRGDWASRSRQNYLLWSYSITANSTTTYYLKLAAENGDVVSVQSTTSSTTHNSEAKKFADGTYSNLCIGDSTHPFKWWHDDSALYKERAQHYLNTSGQVYDIETDILIKPLTATTVTVVSPEGGKQENATASASLVTVIVSTPQATSGGNSTGAGEVGTVSISAASPTALISSTASAALATVSVTSPASTASGTVSSTASASIPSITVGAPLVNETVIEIPLPTPAVSISSPAVQPVINSTASATAPSVTVTTPQASATSAITVDVTLPSITVNAPAPSVSSSSTVSLDLHKASQTFTVTVQSTAYGNKYYIDGVQQASLSLHEEGTYRFDLSDSSVSNHPLRFSTTSNGTHNSGTEYTTGVTVVGTAGSSGAYVEIVVTSSTPDLYYYCTNHSGMGGSIAFSSDFTQVPFILSVSSAAPTLSVGSIGEAQAASVALTAAEATATGAAEATFADSIEVGITAPAPTITVSPTITITDSIEVGITAPAPTITVSSTITITDTPNITISSPSPSANVTANSSLPSITVTTPTATADFDATASASLPTITITSPTGSATADTQTDDVDGSSTATGSGVLLAKGESSLNATATASSTEVLQANGAGALVGQSTATAIGGIFRSGAASVSGSTNASASCTILKDVGSTVNATSTCSGTGLSLLNSSSSVNASSTCSGSAGRDLGALATVSGTATIVASSFVLTPLVAGDVNKLTTITIPADHPRVVTVFADTRRFLTVQSDRPRLIRILA